MHFEIGKRAVEFQAARPSEHLSSSPEFLWIHDWEQLVSRSNSRVDMLVATIPVAAVGNIEMDVSAL